MCLGVILEPPTPTLCETNSVVKIILHAPDGIHLKLGCIWTCILAALLGALLIPLRILIGTTLHKSCAATQEFQVSFW